MSSEEEHLISTDSEAKTSSLIDAMKADLDAMNTGSDREFYSPSKENLEDFFCLYKRYLKTRGKKIKWDKIKPISEENIDRYSELPDTIDKKNLTKVAVLKLNGGLGTTMGCTGPKSGIEIKDGHNFLDLVIRQIDTLRKNNGVEIPIILMNSFNTHKQTKRLLRGYKGVQTFNQSVYPRIFSESLLPVDSSLNMESVYPPGHGDIFTALNDSGTLDKLLSEGKEILFVSNIDNLAATIDEKILNHVITNNIDFCMELTEKTRADVKGGTLVEINGNLTLLEIAQVPSDKKSEFKSIRKFKIFNTNSVWINLKKLKELFNSGKKFELDIIENRKVMGNGEEVIQLETAIGAGIKHFNNTCGLIVPRNRFQPVKSCSDLFSLRSRLFKIKNGELQMSKLRVFKTLPLIKLVGRHFKTIERFNGMFKGYPDIIELDHLTVTGKVKFGKDVVLKGTVIIIADEKSEIVIPDGSILDDKIVYGNLPMMDH